MQNESNHKALSNQVHRAKTRFAKVSIDLLTNQGITAGAVRFWGLLHITFNNPYNADDKGQSYFADLLGVTRQSIRNYTLELESHGWIAVIERYQPGKSQYDNHYYHVFEDIADCAEFRANIATLQLPQNWILRPQPTPKSPAKHAPMLNDFDTKKPAPMENNFYMDQGESMENNFYSVIEVPIEIEEKIIHLPLQISLDDTIFYAFNLQPVIKKDGSHGRGREAQIKALIFGVAKAGKWGAYAPQFADLELDQASAKRLFVAYGLFQRARGDNWEQYIPQTAETITDRLLGFIQNVEYSHYCQQADALMAYCEKTGRGLNGYTPEALEDETALEDQGAGELTDAQKEFMKQRKLELMKKGQ